MSARLALVRISDYPPEIAVSADGHKWYVAGPRLGSQHGWYADDIEIVRPLVMLDLDKARGCWADTNDPAAIVERLRETNSVAAHAIADQIEAQTRPPKPDEPTGLGAVVEDAQGVRWIRKGNTSHGEDWTRQVGEAWSGGSWDRIDAVRVLSEGVTS